MILSVYSVELSWTTGNVLQLHDGVNRVGHKSNSAADEGAWRERFLEPSFSFTV